MRKKLGVLCLVCVMFFPLYSHSFMEYFRTSGEMPTSLDWPKELKALVNTKSMVLGVMGPFADTRIYCAGDTEKLNAFLEDFATVPDTTLKIVLHPGKQTQTMPKEEGEKKAEVFIIDWSLHIAGLFPGRPDEAAFDGKKLYAQVDIWLGGQIQLKQLAIPNNLTVKSSGEWEAFIRKYEKKRN